MPESITLTDEAGDTLAVSALSSYTYITVTEGDQATEVELSNEQADELGRALISGVVNEATDNDALLIKYATDREVYNAEALTLALDRGRLAVFQYEKSKGGHSIEKRRVQPNDAYLSGEGDPIVVGYDPDRGGTRAFRLDRIVGHVRIG